MCSPKVVPKFIDKFFKNRERWFKIQAALKIISERFYTLLSWQDNIDYLEHFLMFRQIAPALLNMLSLKGGDKN